MESFLSKVNKFQIYTQRLDYCLMEKMRNVSYKDWQPFFQKKTKKQNLVKKREKRMMQMIY